MDYFKQFLDSKPSYVSSTFSLSTLVVIVGFTLLCLITKDANSLKDIALIMLGAYGAKKGMEVAGGKPNEPTGHSQEPPKSP